MSLVLTRKENQSIQIGSDIVVTVCQCEKESVKVAIDAPKDIKIIRTELIGDD